MLLGCYRDAGVINQHINSLFSETKLIIITEEEWVNNIYNAFEKWSRFLKFEPSRLWSGVIRAMEGLYEMSYCCVHQVADGDVAVV